jgi:NarL family two-component system response regulator YdfI
MSSDTDSIRVLVSANSAAELAELEAIVRESDSLELVGSSLDRERLDHLIATARPDVLLEQSPADDSEDFPSPDFSRSSCVRVLLLPESDLPAALRAVRNSDTPVRGLLPPWSAGYEIRSAIAAAADGLIVLHPDFAERTLAAAPPPVRDGGPSGEPLSPREHQVLQLLAAGLGNKQIASQLNISEHTVKFHVNSIFDKLNASSRAEAVAIGARRGLILF